MQKAPVSTRSGALSFLHERDEGVEQIPTVVWARGSLGMVLHRYHRQFAVFDPLDGAVVQIHMGQSQTGRAGNLVPFPPRTAKP